MRRRHWRIYTELGTMDDPPKKYKLSKKELWILEHIKGTEAWIRKHQNA